MMQRALRVAAVLGAAAALVTSSGRVAAVALQGDPPVPAAIQAYNPLSVFGEEAGVQASMRGPAYWSLFASPILTSSLYRTNPTELVDDLNDELSDTVIAMVAAFNEDYELRKQYGIEHTSMSEKGINEAFFQWQRDQHHIRMEMGEDHLHPLYRQLYDLPAFRHMVRLMKRAAVRFVESMPAFADDKDGAERAQRLIYDSNVFSWATISYDGLQHLPHIHPDSIVSGVYYPKTPEGSGDIYFEDPRGPQPPFEGRFIHRPSAGDLLCFASYMQHGVSATRGIERRVSFSFNVEGSFDHLAGVHLRKGLA